MGGWMGGRESGVKDCLQQSKSRKEGEMRNKDREKNDRKRLKEGRKERNKKGRKERKKHHTFRQRNRQKAIQNFFF
jgi:hypothetical protein